MNGTLRAKWIAAPFLFISPFFIAYAVFGLYPMLYGFWLSLQKGSSDYSFAGFANYLYVLKDLFFWKAMWNGTQLALGSLVIILPVALGVALLLSRPAVAGKKGFFATFFFTPNITSAVAVGIIFKLILERDSGVLNKFLSLFGVEPIGWLKDPAWTMPALIILCTWKFLGVNILYFLAGLQSVPQELIEAAKIDGAKPLQRLGYVILPLLRPIMTFVVFQCLLGSFGMFSEAFILAGSGFGPENSLVFPTSYLYDQAFRRLDFTYSAALGYVFTILMLVVGMIQLKLFNVKNQGA
ncbi:carbohydrate ABC transporter permease [Paenibacillus nasutitermitis]|uniref:L-arabinose transport system permease protein AraP n=1 Tax=Paenibacillus nasutitermitis TaxID=1652958 RepID=A0A917DYT5_9BACL|nr:sugar ABC transporter permease [Paenibacillus nasutitermitis]GGD79723.1 L-arabinose transport system permease protein AraP [Paenibacillus nasutitermitis]